MRIISRFSDYYDITLAYGLDKQVVYIRENRLIPLGKDTPKPSRYGYGHWVLNYEKMDEFIIGFCGKLYNCLKVTRNIREGEETKRVVLYFFSYDEFKQYVSEHEDFVQKFYRSHARYRHSVDEAMRGIKQFFNTPINIYEKYFVVYNAPIFMIRFIGLLEEKEVHKQGWYIEVNPMLKPFGFYRVRDSFQAFQDISMYVGGVLTNHIEPPQVMDSKVLAAKKGFDNMSFKTLSPGKKEKRRSK